MAGVPSLLDTTLLSFLPYFSRLSVESVLVAANKRGVQAHGVN